MKKNRLTVGKVVLFLHRFSKHQRRKGTKAQPRDHEIIQHTRLTEEKTGMKKIGRLKGERFCSCIAFRSISVEKVRRPPFWIT